MGDEKLREKVLKLLRTISTKGKVRTIMKTQGILFVFSIQLLLSSQSLSNKISDVSVGQQEKEYGGGVVRRSMFPEDFIFGVSTSAYQIEGAYLEDGKGLSNWDVATHIPGRQDNGDTGDIADDHYHRYMEDIENLHKLGVDAYRFSIAWSRILPKGRFGEVNPSGIEFYNKVIDNLLLRGIQPFVTIQHYEIPQELEDRYGGWLSPQIQEDFVYYANICFREFGDRVKFWMTINEPYTFSMLGYIVGEFPPRRCSAAFGKCSAGNSSIEPLIVVHNMLLAHAKAVQLYRQQYQRKQGGHIGITIGPTHNAPYRDDEISYEAAERAYAFSLGWVVDPLVYGDYPEQMREYLGRKLPKLSEEEMKLVKGSVDFIGLNHFAALYAVDCLHNSTACSPCADVLGFTCTTGYRDGVPIGQETGHANFFVVPHGIEEIVDHVQRRYPDITIYVTENGYSPKSQDKLLDFDRIEYHEAYLGALAKSMRNGANVKGYFSWSLMDNYEWVIGYEVTYGLYYVNRTTLERTPKLSALWYADFLANKFPKKWGDMHYSQSTFTT